MHKVVALGLAVLTGICLVGATPSAALADPWHPPMCSYVTTASGAGELSKIGCQRFGADASHMEMASWDDSAMALNDPLNGEQLVALTAFSDITYPNSDSSTTLYVFQFDRDNVYFPDIQRELHEQFGFTHVTLGWTRDDEIYADYQVPSKAKH